MNAAMPGSTQEDKTLKFLSISYVVDNDSQFHEMFR